MNGRRHVVPRFFAEQPMLAAMIALALVLHAGAAMLFRIRAGELPANKPADPRVIFIGVADEATLGVAAIRDPSLTALPSRHGFSARTLASPVPETHPTPVVGQTPRPLGTRPASPVPPAAATAPAINDSLLDRVSPASQEAAAETTLPAATQITITGPLAVRARPSLTVGAPRIEGLAPAQPTVLRVAADNLGRVRYALVEEGSGSAVADRKAVELVRGWQFVPRDGVADGIEWGEVRILWAGGAEAAPAAAPEGLARPRVPAMAEPPPVGGGRRP